MHSFWYGRPWLDLREKYLLAEITVIAGAVVFRKKRSCKSFFCGAGKVTRPWERDHEIRDNIVTTRTTVWCSKLLRLTPQLKVFFNYDRGNLKLHWVFVIIVYIFSIRYGRVRRNVSLVINAAPLIMQFSVRQLLICGIMIFRRAHSMQELQLLLLLADLREKMLAAKFREQIVLFIVSELYHNLHFGHLNRNFHS